MNKKSKHLKKWLKDQPKSRIIPAGLIVLILLYIILGPRFGREYQIQIYNELQLAAAICENSRNWVLADPGRLKLGQGDLRHIPVNGRHIELKYVDYPTVMFLDSGIKKTTGRRTAQDIYCVYADPRVAGDRKYYKYDERIWVEKVRFRR
ncbi:MAG: hypothetical protein H6860_00155 [Rhodospirillales bacterium]|nr:hypothetical protein [Alphaproteobacteria bacterium]MCB9980807.1 hypothetical protein [Rhodospirillales bacterium]